MSSFIRLVFLFGFYLSIVPSEKVEHTVRDVKKKSTLLNPLPPSDAVRQQKILFKRISSVLSQFKKYHPSGNLKFNYSGILQSLKLRILMEKILPISLKLNFTPNTFGCYGLKQKK